MRNLCVLLALHLALPFVAPVVAGTRPRVLRTFGDAAETTCLCPQGADLWVGTLGGGMVRLSPGGRTERFDSPRGLPGNRVRACAEHAGRLWVATDNGLAWFDAPGARFQTMASGRFLALAGAGGQFLAARADGVLLAATEEAAVPVRHLDLTPSALAGASDGRWAVGGLDGRVVLSSGPLAVAPGFPVRALAFVGDELVVLTAGGAFRVSARGDVQPWATPPGTVGLDEAGTPVMAPSLARFETSAVATWNGHTMVATDAGLYADEDGELRAVPLGAMPCGDRIVALAEFGGALWAGSFDRGVCRFDGGAWQQFAGPTYLPSDMVNALAADGTRLYVATLRGLAIVDAARRFDVRTHEQCVGHLRRACPWFPSVTGVAVDSAGAVWAADTGALHRVDGRKWRHFGPSAGIVSQKITKVAARGGQIAVATSDVGVLLGSPESGFRRIGRPQGLADDWIMDVAFARDGALLAATCTRGVSRVTGARIETWTTREGLVDDYTLAVAEVDGRVWVGTLSGLTILGPDGPVTLTTADGLGGNEVHAILPVGDDVYLGTDGGITVLRP